MAMELEQLFEALPDDLPERSLGPGKATWLDNAFDMVTDIRSDDPAEIAAEQRDALEQAFWRAARIIVAAVIEQSMAVVGGPTAV
jgi:hypothetical protein